MNIDKAEARLKDYPWFIGLSEDEDGNFIIYVDSRDCEKHIIKSVMNDYGVSYEIHKGNIEDK